MELDRRLRFEAARHLRQTENIRHALQWIRRNPEGFAARVVELETTIDAMNNIILADNIDDKRFRNVAAVRNLLGEGEPVNTPSDFTGLYDDWKEYREYEESGKIIEGFFPKTCQVPILLRQVSMTF